MKSKLPAISEFIWDAKYRMKKYDGTPIDMTISDTWTRVANALAQAEPEAIREKKAKVFFNAMSNGFFSPAGRIISGAGTGRNVTLSNCFTMGTLPDSMDGIFAHLKEAALTMQQGGGIGYDFSTLRPKGAEVKGVAADASGPLSFMDVWDAMCRTVMSAGSRRGAMMATMRVDHPDIEAFIDAKRDPAKLRMFNLSVLVTDDFMAAVKNGDAWRLHFENRHGETLTEKWVEARDLWNKIMRNTYDFAEPGVIFIDRVNRDHNLGYLETIATTNPCGEKPMGPYASCLLGSVNLAKLVNHQFEPNAAINKPLLIGVVKTAIRMMDNVIEVGNFPLAAQKEKAQQDRQLGLGVTGLADALIMCGLTYGSSEAAEWTETVMRDIAIAAYQASVDLARERGCFPTFNADGFLHPTRFAGRMLPTQLQDDIRNYGIRNGLLISIAPTGTISMFAGNVSSGVEPVFAFEYERKVLQPDGTHSVQVVQDYAVTAFWDYMGGLGSGHVDDLPPQFVSTQTLAPLDHVRMQTAAQKWVDSSISKTVNCPEDISFDDFKAVYTTAYELGCKGCTTYRPNEVTGSILSVKETPKEDLVVGSIPPAEMERMRVATVDFLKREPRQAQYDTLKAVLDSLSLKRVTDVTSLGQFNVVMNCVVSGIVAPEPREDDLDAGTCASSTRIITESGEVAYEGEASDFTTEDWPTEDCPTEDGASTTMAAPDMPKAGPAPVPEGVIVDSTDGPRNDPYFVMAKDAEEAPAERPDVLPGATYKIKWPGSEHALYVNVTDIMDASGRRRPFEVFINSKNMDHFAWTVALTRMISAIFRRPHDSRFVVEELKAVFDPQGGAWMGGKFVPSVLAAIGNKIEEHMLAIGYLDDPARVDVAPKRSVAVPAAMAAPYSVTGLVEPADATQAAQARPAGKLCPKCFGSNLKMENGCPQCLDCGDSKCG